MAQSDVARARGYGEGGGPYTRRILNEIYEVLGGADVAALWPFWESTGAVVTGMAPVNLTVSDELGSVNLEDEYTPRALRASQLNAYLMAAASNHNLAMADNDLFTASLDTDDDSPLSVGMWIAPADVSTVALMAKYVAAAEEWAFRIDGDGKLQLELHDVSASASEIATGENVLDLYKWQMVGATYDGDEADPQILFYQDGVHDGGDGTSVETGSYAGQENTATPMLIGASGVTATPAEEYTGWIALPFFAKKALSADDWAQLYALTRELIG